MDRGSERPAAHTHAKINPSTPPGCIALKIVLGNLLQHRHTRLTVRRAIWRRGAGGGWWLLSPEGFKHPSPFAEQQHLYHWGRPGERNVVQFHAFIFVTIVKINDVTAIAKSSLSRGGKNVEPAKSFPERRHVRLNQLRWNRVVPRLKVKSS